MTTNLRTKRLGYVSPYFQRSTFGYRLGYVMTEPERVIGYLPLTQREIMQQALLNLRTRNIEPHQDVLALAERYALEELTHEQLLDLLIVRTVRVPPADSGLLLA